MPRRQQEPEDYTEAFTSDDESNGEQEDQGAQGPGRPAPSRLLIRQDGERFGLGPISYYGTSQRRSSQRNQAEEEKHRNMLRLLGEDPTQTEDYERELLVPSAWDSESRGLGRARSRSPTVRRPTDSGKGEKPRAW